MVVVKKSSGVDVNGVLSVPEVLGPELVTNGTFASDTGWTHTDKWTISGAKATVSGTGSGIQSLAQTIAASTSKLYKVGFTIARSAGSITVGVGSSLVLTTYTGNATFSLYMGGGTNIAFSPDGSWRGSVSAVSIKEVTSELTTNVITPSGSRMVMAIPLNGSLQLSRYGIQRGTNAIDLQISGAYNQVASGVFSVAAGSSNTASGEKAIAIGNNATASGLSAIAIGTGVSAIAESSIAIGNVLSYAFRSTGIGVGALAYGADSVAIGSYSSADNAHAVAIGYTARASTDSIAIGNADASSHILAIAMGRGAVVHNVGENVWSAGSIEASGDAQSVQWMHSILSVNGDNHILSDSDSGYNFPRGTAFLGTVTLFACDQFGTMDGLRRNIRVTTELTTDDAADSQIETIGSDVTGLGCEYDFQIVGGMNGDGPNLQISYGGIDPTLGISDNNASYFGAMYLDSVSSDLMDGAFIIHCELAYVDGLCYLHYGNYLGDTTGSLQISDPGSYPLYGNGTQRGTVNIIQIPDESSTPVYAPYTVHLIKVMAKLDGMMVSFNNYV